MRKPSIFSKDYERQMKARRKKRIVIVFILILALVLVFTKTLANKLDFYNLKVKIQTWIDSENEIENETESEIKEEEIKEEPSKEESNLNNEEADKETVLIKEFKISNENILKVGYDNLNNKEVFTEVIENKENLYTTFNKNKDLILIIDKNQDMKIFDINNKEKVITKTVYTSPSGENFNKDTILEYYNEYIWHSEAKFISNDKIAYISNMPYFGYDLNKYIWIYDIKDDNHKLLLSSVAKDIKFNELTDKGLEIILDGNVKYINNNGEIVN